MPHAASMQSANRVFRTDLFIVHPQVSRYTMQVELRTVGAVYDRLKQFGDRPQFLVLQKLGSVPELFPTDRRLDGFPIPRMDQKFKRAVNVNLRLATGLSAWFAPPVGSAAVSFPKLTLLMSDPPVTRLQRGLFITLTASTRISNSFFSVSLMRFTRFTSRFACVGPSIHCRPSVPTTPGAGFAMMMFPFASASAL